MAQDRFDFVVIGAGPAGEKAAAQAAYYGKSVAIVDRGERPGGAVVNAGVIPSKTLRETALYLSGFLTREVYGVGMSLTPEHALERLKHRAAEVVDEMARAVAQNLERHGIELVRGTGALRPGRVVEVQTAGGQRALQGDAILIATGSRPFHPPDVDFTDPDVYDSDLVLELDRIPRAMAVLGGGPIACEYASLFCALGVEVTLVDPRPHLLPFADPEISEELAAVFGRMGMRVVLDAGPAAIERSSRGLRLRLADGEETPVDKALFAAGRRGNTDGLGLAGAGVELDARGHIVVDETYRSTAERVFAAGDVIGPPALASVSAEQGRVAACHAFEIDFKRTIDPQPPSGVYSVPELGMAGLTEPDAVAAGYDVVCGIARFANNARARVAGDTEGMVKLVFDAASRALVGVHILGSDATELVHHGQGELHSGGTIDTFIKATYNMPSRTEAYKYAAYDALQRLAERGDGPGFRAEPGTA